MSLACAALLLLETPGFSGLRQPRRAILASAPTFVSMASATPSASGTTAFQHRLTSMQVGSVTIPVAIWQPPVDGQQPTPATYPYVIDIGKIATKLRVGWLSWLPKFDYALPCGTANVAPLPGFSRARNGHAIIFAHGFLGSVYDFSHAAEALAADGFTVVAPELPESLSASYVPPEGLGREEIIAAARGLVDKEVVGRWGIFGHSAGAGSALTQRGDYSLGRACFAGGIGRIATATTGSDPLFLCSSNGDGCNKFMAAGTTDLRQLISGAAPDGVATTLFAAMDDAYAAPGKPPARGAFVFAEDNTAAPLPNHLSFLWSEVNEAMSSLLSPLLPLAKVLGLFVLDFDVYIQNRDADRTAAQLVPALRRFFLSSATAST